MCILALFLIIFMPYFGRYAIKARMVELCWCERSELEVELMLAFEDH